MLLSNNFVCPVSRFTMSGKVAALFFLCFALNAASGTKRTSSDAPMETVKMQQVAAEVIKLIDEGATIGDDETSRLRAAANNMHFYFYNSIYYFYKSIHLFQDSELRQKMVTFIMPAQLAIYKIGAVVNGNSTQIKATLKDSMRKLIELTPMVKLYIPQLDTQNMHVALNVAKHSYDCALYTYLDAFAEIKFRSKSYKRIEKEIGTTIEGIFAALKKLDTKDQGLDEFVAFTHLLNHYFHRIILKIERWAYVYRSKDLQSVSEALVEITKELRRRAHVKALVPELQKALQECLEAVRVEVLKLSNVAGDENRQGQDIYKDVILDVLVNALTLQAKLELFLTET